MITSEEITALNERLTKAHKANDALKVKREVHEKTLRDKARALCEQGIEGIEPNAEIATLIQQIEVAFEKYSHDLEEQVSFNKQLLDLVESGDYVGASALLGTPTREGANAPVSSVPESGEPSVSTPEPVKASVESDTPELPPIKMAPSSNTVKSSDDLDSILNDALFSFGTDN